MVRERVEVIAFRASAQPLGCVPSASFFGTRGELLEAGAVALDVGAGRCAGEGVPAPWATRRAPAKRHVARALVAQREAPAPSTCA